MNNFNNQKEANMPSDHKYFNKSQDHELEYVLRKHELKTTQRNKDTLISLVPNNSTHEEVDEIIQKNIVRFEK
ncbi:hypothetical protein [Rodentibacter trehalosifermentans]|nr:hypothetical protein [Rodentibacter trehalosifermentans]